MLVLTRRKHERVVVKIDGHEPLVVEIVDVIGDKVRLGFEAPREISIWRQEIYQGVENSDAKPSVQ